MMKKRFIVSGGIIALALFIILSNILYPFPGIAFILNILGLGIGIGLLIFGILLLGIFLYYRKAGPVPLPRFLVALIVALVFDFFDIVLAPLFQIPVIGSIVGDAIPTAVLTLTLGAPALILTIPEWLDFLPLVDSAPFFTLSVLSVILLRGVK